jgi:hypothetical protein
LDPRRPQPNGQFPRAARARGRQELLAAAPRARRPYDRREQNADGIVNFVRKKGIAEASTSSPAAQWLIAASKQQQAAASSSKQQQEQAAAASGSRASSSSSSSGGGIVVHFPNQQKTKKPRKFCWCELWLNRSRTEVPVPALEAVLVLVVVLHWYC